MAASALAAKIYMHKTWPPARWRPHIYICTYMLREISSLHGTISVYNCFDGFSLVLSGYCASERLQVGPRVAPRLGRYLGRGLGGILGGYWGGKTRTRRSKMVPRRVKITLRRPELTPRRAKEAPGRAAKAFQREVILKISSPHWAISVFFCFSFPAKILAGVLQTSGEPSTWFYCWGDS